MRLPAGYLAQKYQDDVFRAALSVCRDVQDAQDAAQDAFVQYLRSDRDFTSEEHIKAWLLRVAMNRAKNATHTFWRRKGTAFEDYMAGVTFDSPQDADLVAAVMALPASLRAVIHLYYYEGYSVAEVAELLDISQSAVKSRLLRGRRALKNKLKGDCDDKR